MPGLGEKTREALAEWLARRQREVADHPALVAAREARWRREVTALGARAAADWPDDEVVDLEVLADTAFRVELSSGARWVYRSRDVRLGAWFIALCRELNQRGLAVPLHERRLVARDGYGWDEPVVARPPASLARFFHAAGALLRLLQECRAVDMHRRNVIGAGDAPAVVDFDGLYARAAPNRLSRTPLGVGLLPTWVHSEAGLAALDFGGLAWRAGGKVPLWRWRDGARVLLEETTPPPGPADPWPHRDALLAGYDELDALLAREPALCAPPAEVPVRSWRIPSILLELSLEESLRQPPDERERWLAARIGGAELAALREGELPVTTAPLAVEGEIDRDRALIVAALAVAGEPAGEPAAPRPSSAAAVAEEVLAGGLDVGVVWLPGAGVRTLGALPPDLLSGAAGAAIVLARVYAATGDLRFADGARRELAKVADAVRRRTIAWPGLYCGLAGQLRALRIAGALLDDRAALTLATVAAPAADVFPDAPDDLVFGVAGLEARWVRQRLAERRARGSLRAGPTVGRAPAWLPSLEDAAAWVCDGVPLPIAEQRVEEPDPVPVRYHQSALTGRLGMAYALLRDADPSLPPLRR